MGSERRSRTKEPSLLRDVLNVPNILTYGRIAAIPAVIYFMYDPSRMSAFIACAIYSAAALTDLADGWLARNLNQQSILGKFLDPLADKLIVMAVLVMLVHLDRVPAWLVVLLLSRELAITGLRSIASTEGLSIDVSQTGKFKTAFQLCGLVGLILHYPYHMNYYVMEFDLDFHTVGLMAVAISLFFSIFSAVTYFYRFMVAINRKHKSSEEASP